MELELINTGTELLLGEVVNTHTSWLGQQLLPLGWRIRRQGTLPDGRDLLAGFSEARARGARVVLVTGGLGPTSDDLTREALAELYGLALREDGTVRRAIEVRCERRGVIFRESMARQALVPEGAIVLPNSRGTAPGLFFEGPDGVRWFLLPGPPGELYPMFAAEVEPRLRELIGGESPAAMRLYRAIGVGESEVEAMIGGQIEAGGKIEVGYCARPGEVDLRLIGPSEELAAWEVRIEEALGANLFAVGRVTLENVVVEMLGRVGQTVATAESCTGGLLANRLTDVPGASAVFQQGVVAYANEVKMALLGVPEELLAEHGSVSAEVACAMAEGVRKRAGADYGLSTTGIAGPSGGTPEKPVGLVFYALATAQRTVVLQGNFPGGRETFKRFVTQKALDLLRRELHR
jgi:nicotinamide-nucleotide amidase